MTIGTAGLALLLAVSATGCGISTGAPEVLPGGVVAPAVSPAPAGPDDQPGPAAGVPARIFLVVGAQLLDVPRRPQAPGLAEALRLLLEGPTSGEIASGLRSAIPPGTEVHNAAVQAGTAVVDLNRSFVDVGGEEQILAVGQLVLTATAVPGIEAVRFALDGEELEVPTADGTLVRRPLAPGDYTALRVGTEAG